MLSDARMPETTYQKILDLRKRPIRGLRRRKHNFYARLTVETRLDKINRAMINALALAFSRLFTDKPTERMCCDW
jgi:hypothetical protein